MRGMFVAVMFLAGICIYGSTYTVIDVHGRKHTYDRTFERIISLYPAHTEILTDIGAGKYLAGVAKDREQMIPEGVTEFALGDSAEKFIAVNPDLVLVRPMVEAKYGNLIGILRSRGVEVISLHPKNSLELEEYWLSLGRLSGREKEAMDYIGRYRKRAQELEKERGRKEIRGFFEARSNRGIYTSARDSIASHVLEMAGVKNIFQERQGGTGSSLVPLKYEELLARGDEVEIYILQRGTMNRRRRRDVETQTGGNLIKGVREGRILEIDERIISRPTAGILDAVEAIQRYIEEGADSSNKDNL